MPKDITIPAVIIFLKEMYEKEGRVRTQWISKHRDKLELAATLQREPTNYYESDVVAHNMKGGLAAISRDHVVAGYNRRKVPLRDAASLPGIKDLKHTHSIVTQGLGDPKNDPRLARPDTDLSIDPVMRPIEPTVKQILYEPRPTYGRECYLTLRAKKWPEKKYYFPECSNWDYGWRTADSGMHHMPEYGRRWMLHRILNNRVGPQPDPKHYRPGDIPGVEKCGFR